MARKSGKNKNMKIVIYILAGIVFAVLLIFIIGLLLPKQRTFTKQAVFNAPIETVFNAVTDNRSWEHRTTLDDLRIIETNDDFEIWEEVSGNTVIRFTTTEKHPYTLYSFEMESGFFRGKWFGEFETIENGKTRITATEIIEYRNPFIRVMAHIFFDLEKFMEIYFDDLRNKLEKAKSS